MQYRPPHAARACFLVGGSLASHVRRIRRASTPLGDLSLPMAGRTALTKLRVGSGLAGLGRGRLQPEDAKQGQSHARHPSPHRHLRSAETATEHATLHESSNGCLDRLRAAAFYWHGTAASRGRHKWQCSDIAPVAFAHWWLTRLVVNPGSTGEPRPRVRSVRTCPANS